MVGHEGTLSHEMKNTGNNCRIRFHGKYDHSLKKDGDYREAAGCVNVLARLDKTTMNAFLDT